MKKIFFILAIIGICFSCAYDNLQDIHPAPPPCDTTGTISFATDIHPIFVSSCGTDNVACHKDQSSDSGYGLATYDDVDFTIYDSGSLIQSVTHDASLSSSDWMPQGVTDKIDNCSIMKIEAWVNRGHKNN